MKPETGGTAARAALNAVMRHLTGEGLGPQRFASRVALRPLPSPSEVPRRRGPHGTHPNSRQDRFDLLPALSAGGVAVKLHSPTTIASFSAVCLKINSADYIRTDVIITHKHLQLF